jgi:ArsR family transcriptional regulator
MAMGKSKSLRQRIDTCNNMNLPQEVSEAITDIGGLERLSCSIPTLGEIASEADLHRALSDKTRLAILWSIKCCDMCPCVLKEFLKIPDSKLSYHLSLLEQTGLVESYRKKNWKIYTITKLGRSVLGFRSKHARLNTQKM